MNIIANAILRGKSVALVSNNNPAVDNVRDKLNKYNYGFIYAHLGNKKNQEAFFSIQLTETRDITKNQLDLESLERIKNEVVDYSHKLMGLMAKEREQQSIKEKLDALRLEQAYYNSWMNAFISVFSI